MQTVEQLDTLTEQALEERDYQKAQAYAWQQIDLDKLRESAYIQLMTALAKSGQRSAAMAQYEIYSKRLEVALGAKPSVELAELYQSIQNEELQQTVLRSQVRMPDSLSGYQPHLLLHRHRKLHPVMGRTPRGDVWRAAAAQRFV